MNCPKCQSTQIIKYGHTHLRQTSISSPRLRTTVCREREPTTDCSGNSRQLIDKLLLERLALAAIAQVTGVSERWLQLYVNQKYYQTQRQ